MIETNKRLYYKYFDLFRVSEFCSFASDSFRAQRNMAIIQKNFDVNLVALSIQELEILGFDTMTCLEIQEFSSTNNIGYVTSALSSVEKWILNLILPDFFSLPMLRSIFLSQKIVNKRQLEDYFTSSIATASYGDEQAELYIAILLETLIILLFLKSI